MKHETIYKDFRIIYCMTEQTFIEEEGIKVPFFSEKISKELPVFYNPAMKLNRDTTLLVLKTYFKDRTIKACDPMCATGIREMRLLKTIPEVFDKFVCGDISRTAIDQLVENFKLNDISTCKLELKAQNAINTLAEQYYDYIEVDPFGSPVPFLDIACQRIKSKGLLSVTATDTAALCGTYPKTSLRKYGIKMSKTLWYEELGLRNLIAYCQRIAAQYEKNITPILSYTDNHYYKIFFKVENQRTKALQDIKNQKYIEWDKKTQRIDIKDLETKDSIGKTFIGNYCDKEFISSLLSQISLISDKKQCEKLLTKLLAEPQTVGHYDPYKFCKELDFQHTKSYEDIFAKVKELGYEIARAHNSDFGIKTNCPVEKVIEILKN